MADIAGLAASAAGGGLFGLVGTALGRLAGFFEKRQQLAHEKARWPNRMVGEAQAFRNPHPHAPIQPHQQVSRRKPEGTSKWEEPTRKRSQSEVHQRSESNALPPSTIAFDA